MTLWLIGWYLGIAVVVGLIVSLRLEHKFPCSNLQERVINALASVFFAIIWPYVLYVDIRQEDAVWK